MIQGIWLLQLTMRLGALPEYRDDCTAEVGKHPQFLTVIDDF